MPTTSLAPVLKQRYLDANGAPLAGGKLYTYQAGTSTPQATYTDSTGGTANANPVVLDANGEANVWLDISLSYKFLLKNSSDVDQWTTDNVIGLLTNNSVATASIQDLAVTTAKLAANAVTSAKLSSSASIDLSRAVTTDHIRDLAVTTAKIAALGVTIAKMAAGNAGKFNVTAQTSTYTAVSGDLVKCTSGTFTVNLPAASGWAGENITVKNLGTGTITVDGNSSETIDGSATHALFGGDSATYVSDGTNVVVI